VQVTAMSDEWLTYEEVAVRLGVTPRAARARAFRGRWSKTAGNDGRARVRLPDERPAPARNTTVRPTDSALMDALREHNATLKADVERLEALLADERQRTDKQASDFAARAAQHAAELKAEQAQTEKAIAAFSALADRLDALAAERAKPWWRRLAG
jgi:hypothetical protein